MSVAELLSSNPHLELLPTNKILCTITGHELPVKYEIILAHISSKKYKKYSEWYTHDFSEYLPYIIENKKSKFKLFCTLTREPLNKIPDEVKKHVNGKRFKKLKAEYEEREQKKLEDEKRRKEKKERLEALKTERSVEGGDELDAFDSEPECWVPDFNVHSDVDEDEEDNDEEVDEDDDEDDEEEEEEVVEEKPKNKKRKLVKMDDSDDEAYIIKSKGKGKHLKKRSKK